MATKYISVQHLAGIGSRDSEKIIEEMGTVSFSANVRGSIHSLKSWTRSSVWVPYNSEHSVKMCLGKVLSGLGCGFYVILS